MTVGDDLGGGGAWNRLSCVAVDVFRFVGVDGFRFISVDRFSMFLIVVDGLD